MIHSQVELCELHAHRLVDQVPDGVGDVPARAPGLHPVFLGHEVAQVGQPGGDGKPDAVHECGDGCQGAADDGVQDEDKRAEGLEERGDDLAQRVCTGFEKRLATPPAREREKGVVVVEQQRAYESGVGELTQPELQECFDASLATPLHDPLSLVDDAHQVARVPVLVNKGLVAE